MVFQGEYDCHSRYVVRRKANKARVSWWEGHGVTMYEGTDVCVVSWEHKAGFTKV